MQQCEGFCKSCKCVHYISYTGPHNNKILK